MKMRTALLALVGVLAWSASPAKAQITVNLTPGNLTYQFADATTGAPITNLNIPNVGGSATVALYLMQTGGTPSNLFTQLGLEGLGVRLIYNNPVGIVQVPGGSSLNTSITGNPNMDFLQRSGSATNPPGNDVTTNTTTNAALSEGFLSNIPPAFPGPEDPLNNPLRILIGKFTLTGMAQGSVGVQAVDPFTPAVNNLTGPNPPTAPPDGFHGEVSLDQYLTQYAAVPSIPTLNVVVGVPEPGTMALCSFAAAGFVAWRRRQRKHTPTVAA